MNRMFVEFINELVPKEDTKDDEHYTNPPLGLNVERLTKGSQFTLPEKVWGLLLIGDITAVGIVI